MNLFEQHRQRVLDARTETGHIRGCVRCGRDTRSTGMLPGRQMSAERQTCDVLDTLMHTLVFCAVPVRLCPRYSCWRRRPRERP